MGSVAITGNVIPEEWYKHVVKKATGKPYLLAITILADLVYWYRPTEVRDERTGEVIGWKKKFHGELLQKSYQEYANKYGESKKTIKLAFDQLVELGVIRRYFYNVEYSNGRVIPNQMFIDLNIQVLKAISYPAEDGGNTSKRAIRKLVPCNIADDPDIEEGTGNNEICIAADKAENICRQNGQCMLTNLSGYPNKKVDISPSEKDTYADSFGEGSYDFGEGYPSDAVRTNTYNNSNNSYKDHIISINPKSKTYERRTNAIDEIKQKSVTMDHIVRSHKNYDWHMENDDPTRKDYYHELYLLIHDVMCGNQTMPLTVNKTAVDPDDVQTSRPLPRNVSRCSALI